MAIDRHTPNRPQKGLFRWSLTSTFVVLLLSGLWACPGALSVYGLPCKGTEDDCGEGFVCYQSHCRPIEEVPRQEPPKENSTEPRREASKELIKEPGERQDKEPHPDLPDAGERIREADRPEQKVESLPDDLAVRCPISKNTTDVALLGIEGDGTTKPIDPTQSPTLPTGANKANRRFQRGWQLRGNALDKLTGTELHLLRAFKVPATKTIFTQADGLILDSGDKTMRKLTLPKSLIAGVFCLYGLLGAQRIALAQVFVLQGEQGPAQLDAATLQQLKALLGYVKTDTTKKKVTISGANLQIDNGSGDSKKVNGLGNLIIGYNEDRATPAPRNGSHNLIIGPGHAYSSYGGLASGSDNTLKGEYSVALSGQYNEASGKYSVLLGGGGEKTDSSAKAYRGNKASGDFSVVVGGLKNEAQGNYSSVFGGGGVYEYQPNPQVAAILYKGNTAKGEHSVLIGGISNESSGTLSVAIGGASNVTMTDQQNQQIGALTVITGGVGNRAAGPISVVSGGNNNLSVGYFSMIVGGIQNISGDYPPAGLTDTIGTFSMVIGGRKNRTIGEESIVLGGTENISGDAPLLQTPPNLPLPVGQNSVIVGGKGNKAYGSYSVIVAGDNNRTGAAKNATFGTYACIVAGANNIATGEGASVTGGSTNTASGKYSAVSGGSGNKATANLATVSGDKDQLASKAYEHKP